MSRLSCLGLLVACVAGVGSPAPTEAGVIPWLYDSVFGPVGSIQARSGYAPYSAGYTPYSVGYTPYSVGYTPYYGGYSSYYYGNSSSACGCSPCAGACGTGCASGNCATGNCATGNCATGNCSTTANSAPNGTLAPVPDPANSAKSIENRLEVIERHLHIRPPATTAPRTGTPTYTDDVFKASPNRNGGTSGNGETDTTVPSRIRRGGTGNENFDPPIPADEGRYRERGEENSDSAKKIQLPSELGPEGSVIPSKKPAAVTPVEEKGSQPDDKGTKTEEKSTQTLKLDGQVTSRAVSPRERLSIPVGFAKPVVAASKKPASKLQVDAQPQAMNVARH